MSFLKYVIKDLDAVPKIEGTSQTFGQLTTTVSTATLTTEPTAMTDSLSSTTVDEIVGDVADSEAKTEAIITAATTGVSTVPVVTTVLVTTTDQLVSDAPTIQTIIEENENDSSTAVISTAQIVMTAEDLNSDPLEISFVPTIQTIVDDIEDTSSTAVISTGQIVMTAEDLTNTPVDIKDAPTIQTIIDDANKPTVAVSSAEVIVTADDLKNTPIDINAVETIVDVLAKEPETKTEVIVVAKSETLTKEEVLKVLTESQKADLSIAIRSKSSDPIEYNTLKVPQPHGTFIYRYWEIDEARINIQEDPALDPLLNKKLNSIPKFVDIKWDSTEVSEQISENKISKTQETTSLSDTVFRDPRGSSRSSNGSIPNPISRFFKNLNLVKEDSMKGKIVDIHEIEKAFDSVSNKHEFVGAVFVKAEAINSSDVFTLDSLDLIKK